MVWLHGPIGFISSRPPASINKLHQIPKIYTQIDLHHHRAVHNYQNYWNGFSWISPFLEGIIDVANGTNRKLSSSSTFHSSINVGRNNSNLEPIVGFRSASRRKQNLSLRTMMEQRKSIGWSKVQPLEQYYVGWRLVLLNDTPCLPLNFDQYNELF